MLNEIDRLKQFRSKELEYVRKDKSKFEEHRDNYMRIKDKLSTLADELEYDVFIPIAYSTADNFEYTTAGQTTKGNNKDLPLAFMPGKLVHTNEILIHLGDNYFVKRSAKQSSEIAERKLIKCNELLDRLNKNEKQIEEWLNKIDELKNDSSKLVEIHEDYNEEEEKKWKEKHKENIRKQKEKEKKERELIKDIDLEEKFALLSTVVEKTESTIKQKLNEQKSNKPISKFKQQMLDKKK